MQRECRSCLEEDEQAIDEEANEAQWAEWVAHVRGLPPALRALVPTLRTTANTIEWLQVARRPAAGPLSIERLLTVDALVMLGVLLYPLTTVVPGSGQG